MNKIRDFSSGILKQLANVLKMVRNMSQSAFRPWPARRVCWPTTSQVPPLASILALAEALNALDADREFFGQFAVAENFHAVGAAIGQADRAQRRFIHSRAVVKLVQVADVDRDVARRETGVVETALGNAADERHLAAFKTDADGTAGTRGLALAAATGGFAVAAGFALAEPLAAVLRAGTGFEIVQSHKILIRPATASGAFGVSTFLISKPRLL